MFSQPATPTIARIVAFCARRYNEANRGQHELALAFMAIINKANDFQQDSPNPELSLVSWLGFTHEPDLVPAVAEVIEHLQRAN